MPGPLQQLSQLGRLAGAEASAADLLDLVPQQLEPPLDLARLEVDVRERRSVLAPALDGPRHRKAQLRVTAERVEQLALPALVEEARLLVLAVDLDERADGSASRAAVTAPVVEPRRRAPAGADFARRDQRLRHSVEQRLDPRRLGPMPDERRVGARPERQSERIDQQALPGPGLAGQDIQPGLELEPQPLDQREVAHGELQQPPRAVAGLSRLAS